MRRITIQRMSLLNFKGIRELTLDFRPDVTIVAGANGTGKTTLFDAFTWTLFGKDSLDRKQFGIKTLDTDGNVIPKLPHEVTVTLLADDEVITLRRCYNEKWQRRRGSATEEFTGHEEERYYNGVPCSTKEWAAKIAALCDEAVFKSITSTTYFASLKEADQRQILFRMVGGLSDGEVLEHSGNREDFAALLDRLSGKTMDEYRREVGARKRECKAGVDKLHERLSERRRDAEAWAGIDFAALRAEFDAKNARFDELGRCITDEAARMKLDTDERVELAKRLAGTRLEIAQREADIRNDVEHNYRESVAAREAACRRIEDAEALIADLGGRKAHIAQTIDRYTSERNACIEELSGISAMTLSISESDLVCPTCGHPLDIDGIERRKAEMVERFNARKAALIEENRRKGSLCSKWIIAEWQAKATAVDQAIAKAEQQLAEAIKERDGIKIGKKPDASGLIHADKKIATLRQAANQLDAAINRPARIESLDADKMAALQTERDDIKAEIANLYKQMHLADEKERTAARIAELEADLKQTSALLAELEGIEFTMAEFAKARVEALEDKINALFERVRFKMYNRQINGGEVETCEATVDGVPYGDLNTAGRINAGLDIINAITRFEGISAPVFIDNAESVLNPVQTIGQQVRLIVADEPMTIKN